MRIRATILAAVIVLAACGNDDDSQADTTTTTRSTTPTTSAEPEPRLHRDTEVALRRCAKRQANLALEYSLDFADPDAFDAMTDACDEAIALAETDDSGAAALIGMDISISNMNLSQWRLDIASTGEARPNEAGLTPREFAEQRDQWMSDLIADLND